MASAMTPEPTVAMRAPLSDMAASLATDLGAAEQKEARRRGKVRVRKPRGAERPPEIGRLVEDLRNRELAAVVEPAHGQVVLRCRVVLRARLGVRSGIDE